MKFHDTTEFKEWIQHAGKCTTLLDTQDKRDAAKICFITREVMLDRATSMIEE